MNHPSGNKVFTSNLLNRRNASRLVLGCASLVIFGVAPRSARCEDFDLIPSISLTEEYSDNIYFSSGSRTSAFATVISPRLELAKKDERINAALTIGLDEFIYSAGGKITTALNHSYRGRGSYLVDPRLRLSTEASYVINERPDRELERNGIVIDSVRRDQQNYSIGADYTLSEKIGAGVAYSYSREDYSGLSFSDNSTHAGSLAFTRDLRAYLPSCTGRLNLGYSRYELFDSITGNYTATAGIGWAFSELWDITADLGGRHTRSSFNEALSLASGTNVSNGWVGKVVLSVHGETDSGSVTVSRNVALSASRTSASETNSLDLSWRRRFTWELSGNVAAGYRNSTASADEFSSQKIDEDYLRFNAGIRYEFNRHIAVDVSYAFTKALYNQNDTTANRNTFTVNFTASQPLLDLW